LFHPYPVSPSSPPLPSPPPSPSQPELVEYYYYWKKTSAGLTSRNTRRQRKMAHIRLGRALLKPPEPTPEREFSKWRRVCVCML